MLRLKPTCGTADILCVLGRGIEKVDGRWKSTSYIEKLGEHGRRTGVRASGLDINSADESLVVAGGNANTLAAVHLFGEMRDCGASPKFVLFAAGRPGYLEQEPDTSLSEGRVMSQEFLRRVGELDGAQIVVFDKNKNTAEDLSRTLEFAEVNSLKKIVIITVRVHVPRCSEFLGHALEKHPYFHKLSATVGFVAAEEVLSSRHRLYRKILREGVDSAAYARTAMIEWRGITAFRTGTYASGTSYGTSRPEGGRQ